MAQYLIRNGAGSLFEPALSVFFSPFHPTTSLGFFDYTVLIVHIEPADKRIVNCKVFQTAFRPAVELSYLLRTEQEALFETMSYEDATPSLAQAIKMKEFSKNGKLSPDVILSIMSEQKPNQNEKITFKAERLRQYIPSSVPILGEIVVVAKFFVNGNLVR